MSEACQALIVPVLSIPGESGTFQYSAATTFNKLPVASRNIAEYNFFCCSVKRQLLCKELWVTNTIVNFLHLFISIYLYILFLELVHSVDIVDEEKTKQGNKN